MRGGVNFHFHSLRRRSFGMAEASGKTIPILASAQLPSHSAVGMPKVEEDGNNNERLQLGHKSDVIVEEGEREGTMIFCPWVSDR